MAFTEDEIVHWLLPHKGVIKSFVVNDERGTVTDFLMHYYLPSTILGRDDSLFAPYSFYNTATSVNLTDLMRDALIIAKNGGADVFNALGLMETESFLSELKFEKGDGNLQYYLYNWACPYMESKEVGNVLL